jgi:hypothetical protein
MDHTTKYCLDNVCSRAGSRKILLNTSRQKRHQRRHEHGSESHQVQDNPHRRRIYGRKQAPHIHPCRGLSKARRYDVPINDTKPMFIYCAQGPHCQLGLVIAVNACVHPFPFMPDVRLLMEGRNGNETFAAYKAAAAKAEKKVPASNFRGGVMGSIPAAEVCLLQCKSRRIPGVWRKYNEGVGLAFKWKRATGTVYMLLVSFISDIYRFSTMLLFPFCEYLSNVV